MVPARYGASAMVPAWSVRLVVRAARAVTHPTRCIALRIRSSFSTLSGFSCQQPPGPTPQPPVPKFIRLGLSRWPTVAGIEAELQRTSFKDEPG
jgi:hypothetical protein